MKNDANRWLVSMLASIVMLLLMQQPMRADTQSVQRSIAQSPDHRAPQKDRVRQYQERRIGNRLERVTITRTNQFTEIYRNNRADTIWAAEENEIGEVPNMRQWVIGTW